MPTPERMDWLTQRFAAVARALQMPLPEVWPRNLLSLNPATLLTHWLLQTSSDSLLAARIFSMEADPANARGFIRLKAVGGVQEFWELCVTPGYFRVTSAGARKAKFGSPDWAIALTSHGPPTEGVTVARVLHPHAFPSGRPDEVVSESVPAVLAALGGPVSGDGHTEVNEYFRLLAPQTHLAAQMSRLRRLRAERRKQLDATSKLVPGDSPGQITSQIDYLREKLLRSSVRLMELADIMSPQSSS